MDSQSTISPYYVSVLQLCNPSSVGQQFCKLVLCHLASRKMRFGCYWSMLSGVGSSCCYWVRLFTT